MEKSEKFLNKINRVMLRYTPEIKNIIRSKRKRNKISNMEMEIQEEPSIIAKLRDEYITSDGYILINIPLNVNKIIFVASGSSYNCAYVAAEALKEKAQCDAECIYSSEFKMYETYKHDDNTLYIFVSQSGETSDTLYVLNEISKYTSKIMCIVNKENSSIWKNSNYKILVHAGEEKSIASTKAMMAQLCCLALLVLKIMHSKNLNISDDLDNIRTLPEFLETILQNKEQISNIARNLAEYKHISILGTRMYYALAKEGALKIKETSYINTTAYPQGEFMHGHVAILNQKSAVVAIFDQEEKETAIKNLNKIKEKYSAYILAISNAKDNKELKQITNQNIEVNAFNKIHNIFGSLIILQIISLEIAKKLKHDIDNPIGLSKIVIN